MSSYRYLFWALCGLIFIDGIGLGLIFPILTPVYLDPEHAIVAASLSVNWKSFYYGLTLAVFSLGLFFSAPILGDFSDGLGRRKILIFTVYAVSFCYVLSALAIIFKSVWLLVLSRLLSGCVSGSQPIAQAAIMDLSAPAQKSKNLGYVFLFTSVGFTVGPLLGSWLSNSDIIAWFNLSTPMFAAALASAICGVVLQSHFKETLVEPRAVSFRPLQGVVIIYKALGLSEVRPFLLVTVLLQLAWSCFFQMMPLYLVNHLGFSAAEVGNYVAVVAIGFGLAFCGCIGYLTKRFQELSVLKVMLWVACGLFAASFLFPVSLILWLIALPLGFCVAHIYVLSTTLASNGVPASYQGWLMGANMGLVALAWFATPLIASVLVAWSGVAPFVFSFVMALAAAGLLVKRARSPKP